MEVYEKPTAILVSLLGCEAFRELLVITRDVYEGHHGQRGTPWRL